MSRAFTVPFALIAFLGFVALAPPWMWFVNSYPHDLSTEAAFLAQLVLPATASLFLASHLQPGG